MSEVPAEQAEIVRQLWEAVERDEVDQWLVLLIVKINAPYEHRGGSIRLESSPDGGTNAVWTSEYEIPVPVLGGLFERLFSLTFGRGFASTLEESGRVAAQA